MKWHFNRLTDEQKLLARQLFADRDNPEKGRTIIKLMDLYNEHRVSPDYLTPCCSLKQIIDWTQWAISKGEI